MDILLETERLRLRRFTTADAEQLYHLDNDPEVMRFINGGTPASREIIEHEMLPVFLRYAENLPGYGFWAVIEKGSDTFLGWLCFRPVADSLTEVSLGYRLHQAATTNDNPTASGSHKQQDTPHPVADTSRRPTHNHHAVRSIPP